MCGIFSSAHVQLLGNVMILNKCCDKEEPCFFMCSSSSDILVQVLEVNTPIIIVATSMFLCIFQAMRVTENSNLLRQ